MMHEQPEILYGRGYACAWGGWALLPSTSEHAREVCPHSSEAAHVQVYDLTPARDSSRTQGPSQAPAEPGHAAAAKGVEQGAAPRARDERLAAAARLAPLLQGARAAEGPNPCPDPASHPARGAYSKPGTARGRHAGNGSEPNPEAAPEVPPVRAHRSLPEMGSPRSPCTPQLGARDSADCVMPAAGAGQGLRLGPSSGSTRSVQGTAPWRSSSTVEATPVLSLDARCPMPATCAPNLSHSSLCLHTR